MIPGSVELFGADAAVATVVPPQQVQGQPPQHRQILGRMPRARPALIFVELHVQHPMHLVFHAPMFPHRPRKGRHVQRQARQIIASFHRALAPDFPFRLHHPHRLQARPRLPIGKPFQRRALIIAPRLPPPVPLLHRLAHRQRRGRGGRAGGPGTLGLEHGVIQKAFDLRMGRFMIAFERQHILRVGFLDFLGNGFLALQGS